MFVLNPREFVVQQISEEETLLFEAFLDRNFPGWRDREILKQKNAGTVEREWLVGVDEIERHALFRKRYVEVFDDFMDLDDNDREARIHFLKQILCDIDGDLTPVATWGRRE